MSVTVALLAEGVDRNFMASLLSTRILASPSSRRAWIEISLKRTGETTGMVALLAEGVDRNLDEMVEPLQKEVSPSSRRAWIEIP